MRTSSTGSLLRAARVLAAVHLVADRDRLESPIGNVLVESTDEIGPPHFSRDGSRILFADAGALAVVDSSRRVSAVGEKLAPSGYGWSPAGDEIWMTVVVGSTTEVRAVRPGGSERLVAAFPGAFLLLDVARNGRVLADRIESENFESIHNHSAYAMIEHDKDEAKPL